jgi:hypothetical protein
VLKELQGEPFAVKFYGCGRGPTFNYMIMGLVGDNLSVIRKKMSVFSLSNSISFRFSCRAHDTRLRLRIRYKHSTHPADVARSSIP